jgi:holin-like protein
LTHFVLPAPILGIIVFAILLKFNIIKKEWVKDICNLLLNNMPLFFVPLFVGIINYYGLIQKNLIPILLNVVLTTTITLIITAIFVENVIKFVRLHKIRKFHDD